MPKLAANVSMMFAEVDFLQRFAAAARAGFRAVEYQYPYDWKPADLSAAVRDAGVEVVLHNMPQGDAALGERGTASLQYDVFHMQLMEGNLALTIERLLPRIGHLQIADVPGRNEPGTGEINFEFLFGHLDRLGYGGWIGCEYNPLGDTREGLKWAQIGRAHV